MGITHVTVTVRNTADPKQSWDGLFLVDTGAIDSTAPAKVLQEIGLSAKGTRSYELADGTEVKLPITTADLEFMGDIVGGTLIMGPDGAEPILGVTALESVGIEFDPQTKRLKRLPSIRLKKLIPIARSYKLPVSRLIRAGVWSALLAVIFTANGCFMMRVRAPGNRDVSRLHVNPEGYEGAVFVLNNPPSERIVDFFKREFPQSQIAVKNSKSANEVNRGREPLNEFEPEQIVIADKQIELSWAVEDRPHRPTGSNPIYQALSIFTLGLVWPLPFPKNGGGPVQVLHYSTGTTASKIVARDRSENFIDSGLVWFVLIWPFINEDAADPWKFNTQASPGGWADCLEQLFQKRELRDKVLR